MSIDGPHETSSARNLGEQLDGSNGKSEECTPSPKPAPVAGSDTEKVVINKARLDDIKTAFDSLRNMGICIAMLLGLPSLLDTVPCASEAAKVTFSLFVILVVGYLACANAQWTMHHLKEKPTFDWTHKPSQIFVLLIAMLVILSFLVNAFMKLIYPWATAQI
ncbi:hypothetical protein [Pseudomonas syringae]|uniref:hypothetical protein n=1 Tax=Pseudomonas syringae TaxID=317 RepID=UPI001F419D72|nr:hypothetical protein [Pseudomonas syringae]GKQ45605.1 hypothetical protein PSTH2693_10635 [Pseudomonas syringae pv. theae]